MKVRIAHFDQCRLEPWDYPEEEVNMSEQEFDALVSNMYYDEQAEMYYTSNNSTGVQLIEW